MTPIVLQDVGQAARQRLQPNPVLAAPTGLLLCRNRSLERRETQLQLRQAVQAASTHRNRLHNQLRLQNHLRRTILSKLLIPRPKTPSLPKERTAKNRLPASVTTSTAAKEGLRPPPLLKRINFTAPPPCSGPDRRTLFMLAAEDLVWRSGIDPYDLLLCRVERGERFANQERRPPDKERKWSVMRSVSC